MIQTSEIKDRTYIPLNCITYDEREGERAIDSVTKKFFALKKKQYYATNVVKL